MLAPTITSGRNEHASGEGQQQMSKAVFVQPGFRPKPVVDGDSNPRDSGVRRGLTNGARQANYSLGVEQSAAVSGREAPVGLIEPYGPDQMPGNAGAGALVSSNGVSGVLTVKQPQIDRLINAYVIASLFDATPIGCMDDLSKSESVILNP
jgi:hypothetical protein